MRLIYYFIISLLFINCKSRTSSNSKTSPILAYINSTITQKEYNTKIYNPPPPPELIDSINQKVNIKQDSIINNLDPLHIFINDSILFNKNLIYKNTESNKKFSYLKNITKNTKNSTYLDISTVVKQKGIILESINEHQFFKIYPNIRFENNYGGFISFQNLFISENGEKAYFEVNYFKHNLNNVFYVIFAEFQDGKWKFQSEIISIS